MRAFNFTEVPTIAVEDGDSGPAPPFADRTVAWSSTLDRLIAWDGTNWEVVAPVSTVMGQTGNVELGVSDIFNTLGFYPIPAEGAPVQSVFGRSGDVTLTSPDIEMALAFIPYDSSNPDGFVTAATAPVQSVNGRIGAVTLTSTDVTFALAYTPINRAGDTGISGALASSQQLKSTKAGGGSGSGFLVEAANPSIGWKYPGGATDGKAWDITVDTTALSLRLVNDANSAVTNIMTVTRSGMAATSVAFTTPTSISANSSAALSIVGTATNAIGMLVNNTSTRSFVMGVTGSAGVAPAGSWILYDQTANAVRLSMDSVGGLQQLGGMNVSGTFTAYGAANVNGALTSYGILNGTVGVIGTASQGDFSSSGVSSLMAQGPGGAVGAVMSFHRPGAYAIKMGLDTNNSFVIGGWSSGTRVYWDNAGNMVNTGGVTQYSDIRYKRAMIPIDDIADKLLTVDAFTFTDIESNQRRIGVSAQSVAKEFPEAVLSDAAGKLSVAYGNLALAGLIEYVKFNERRMAALREELGTRPQTFKGA